MNTLQELSETIGLRRGASPDSSWTAKLLADGREGCARKFGEEATELVIASLSGNRGSVAREAADVLYHLLVLLAASDVDFKAVLHELESRKNMSGIAEKQSRTI